MAFERMLPSCGPGYPKEAPVAFAAQAHIHNISRKKNQKAYSIQARRPRNQTLPVMSIAAMVPSATAVVICR